MAKPDIMATLKGMLAFVRESAIAAKPERTKGIAFNIQDHQARPNAGQRKAMHRNQLRYDRIWPQIHTSAAIAPLATCLT